MLGVTGSGTIRQIEYGFLFIFHRNYGCILYHFRDKARYWQKKAIFHTHPPSTYQPLGKTLANVFALLFSPPSQAPWPTVCVIWDSPLFFHNYAPYRRSDRQTGMRSQWRSVYYLSLTFAKKSGRPRVSHRASNWWPSEVQRFGSFRRGPLHAVTARAEWHLSALLVTGDTVGFSTMTSNWQRIESLYSDY